jgi:hypothetical protein
MTIYNIILFICCENINESDGSNPFFYQSVQNFFIFGLVCSNSFFFLTSLFKFLPSYKTHVPSFIFQRFFFHNAWSSSSIFVVEKGNLYWRTATPVQTLHRRRPNKEHNTVFAQGWQKEAAHHPSLAAGPTP